MERILFNDRMIGLLFLSVVFIRSSPLSVNSSEPDKSRWISWLYCFLVVNFGWVIFRLNYLKKSLLFIMKMIMPWNWDSGLHSLWEYVDIKTIFVFLCAAAGCGILQRLCSVKVAEWWKNSKIEFVCCTFMLIFSIAAIVSDTYNPFIYFQF